MSKRTLTHVATALALSLGLVAQANAVPMLRLTTSTGATVTVADGAANDTSAAAGLVTFNGPLGDWLINVTTGASKPIYGSAAEPRLDLNSINMTSSGPAGSITLELTDTDFGSQPGGAHVGTVIGGTTTGNVSFRSFFDAANQAFGQGAELTSSAFATSGFTEIGASSLAALNPFSLTLLVTINHDAQLWQMTSFDAMVQVPEPASLLLVGMGLLGLAFVASRRKQAFGAI